MVTTPLVVAEGLDVELYETVQDAELDLEAVDVEEGIYRIFDAEGRKLSAQTAVGGIVIAAEDESTQHKPELEQLLRSFLLSVGDAAAETDDLRTLIERSRRFTFRPPKSWWDVIKGFFSRG